MFFIFYMYILTYLTTVFLTDVCIHAHMAYTCIYMIRNSVRYVVVHTVSNPCMSNSVNFTWEGYIECWGRPGHKLVDVQQMTVACTMYMYNTRKDLFTVG